MARKGKGGGKSVGDTTISNFLKTGKGYSAPMKKTEGEYCGVDRDAKVLQKPGKGFQRK